MTAAEAAPSIAAVEPIKGRSNRPWIVVAVIVLALITGIAAFLVARSNDPSQIEEAAESCGVGGNVGDDGTSITFDTKGEDDLAGDSIVDVACVLSFVEAPDSRHFANGPDPSTRRDTQRFVG